ncbi:MAG: co-chaperone GroES [Candidatus Faecousia sp.]|nr:co-chaperone GroES [Candidatus Faecousia sp.]
MKIQPLADHIVIKMLEAEETTESGIVLATANKEKSQIAAVIAVGPGTEENPVAVKVGDKVLVGKYAGTEVKIDKEEYNVIRMSDVLAIVE